MKKINLLLTCITVIVLSSCSKKEEIQPAADQNQDNETYDYTERNSNAVAWEQLPEKLKAASELQLNRADNGNAKINASYLYAIGPWGGGGGGAFAIYPLASTDKIYAIGIRSGAYVDALVVWYIRANGTLYFYRTGGTGGTYYVQYFASNEIITAMGGRRGAYVDRLTIYTNFKSFSYGGNGGSAFYGSASGNQILGFFGGSGSYLDRIGGYVYSR